MYILLRSLNSTCAFKEDEIIVSFKEGSDGIYRDVHKVVGRYDDRWYKESFTFIATAYVVYVGFFEFLPATKLYFFHIQIRIEFIRKTNLGNNCVGSFYVDQFQFEKYNRNFFNPNYCKSLFFYLIFIKLNL
jgi:hypothetical protein